MAKKDKKTEKSQKTSKNRLHESPSFFFVHNGCVFFQKWPKKRSWKLLKNPILGTKKYFLLLFLGKNAHKKVVLEKTPPKTTFSILKKRHFFEKCDQGGPHFSKLRVDFFKIYMQTPSFLASRFGFFVEKTSKNTNFGWFLATSPVSHY